MNLPVLLPTIFTIYILLGQGESSELTDQAKFHDAYLRVKFQKVTPSATASDSTNEQYVTAGVNAVTAGVNAVSRLSCARSCSLSFKCANFIHTKSTGHCQFVTQGEEEGNVGGQHLSQKKEVIFWKGDLGFEGGRSVSAGRVLARVEGRWGTVCDKSYSLKYWPQTFCHDLGYKTAAKAKDAAAVAGVGSGTGHISIKSLNCYANYGLLSNAVMNFASCGHKDDAYIACSDT